MKANNKANPIGKNAKVPKGRMANTIPKTANTMAKTTNNFLIIYNPVALVNANCPVPTGMLNLIKAGTFAVSAVNQIIF